MTSEEISAINLVHEKWKERFFSKQERNYSEEQRKINDAKNAKNSRVPRQNVDEIIEQGKQRWKEKYGKAVLATRKPKKKRSKAQINTLNVDNLAGFKISPTVKPESLISYRTYMGFSCPCFPQSRRDITSENISQDCLQNVLDVRPELRHPNRLEEAFPCLAFSLQRKTYHKYPDVSLPVLVSSRVQDAVQQYSEGSVADNPKLDLDKTVKMENLRAKQIFDRMKACISNRVIRLVGWSLFKFLGLILRSVQVHRSQLKIIQNLEKKGVPIIYLPLHKSHLDYIIITWIIWIYDMNVPYVAAGNNLSIPIVGPILRALGGFFIRRKLDQNGRKDLVYRAVLQSYMQELLQEGQSLEFFVEGGRSRSGKALYPKGGLLSVIVDAYLQGHIQDAYIVPISISYEKLLEGDFMEEQMGSPKQKESVWGTFHALFQILCGDYGNVRVEFPQPFSAKEFIQSFNFDNVILTQNLLSTPATDGLVSPSSLSSSLSSNASLCMLNVSKENRELVQSLAEHVVYSCVCSTVLMSTNILAFLLLTKHRQGGTLKDIVVSFKDLVNEVKIRSRDIGFSGKSENIIPYAATMLGDNLVKRSVTDSGELFFKPITELPSVFGLSYSSAPVTNVFAMESIIVGACFYAGDFSLGVLMNTMQKNDIYIKREDLYETTRVLIKLFKFEYILSLSCMQVDDAITDAYDILVMKEILQIPTLEVTNCNNTPRKVMDIFSLGDEEDLTYTNDGLMINTSSDECIEKLQFYQHVMLPLCESYLVAANHVKILFESNVPEDKFISSLHTAAKERVNRKLATCSDSAALDILKNAVKALHDLQIIESFHPDGDKNQPKMLSMNTENNVKQRLYDIIDLLEHMRE